MVKTCEFKDPARIELVRVLKKASKDNGSNIWTSVACELERVRKNRREVNLHKINNHTSRGDVVIVPGKVLGAGKLSHDVKIAAYKFSDGAIAKIEKAGGKAIAITELLESNPKGSGVKLMG
ncbi:MAG TPA: 50S ribosomal protein L18e [Candidatus Altiarchaeales archaeon]|nr:50S ribosomal protein L18e [Candidatus Altiarchaeales archaeon]